jgi:hypothetical protein
MKKYRSKILKVTKLNKFIKTILGMWRWGDIHH